jgi:hypothetical protein
VGIEGKPDGPVQHPGGTARPALPVLHPSNDTSSPGRRHSRPRKSKRTLAAISLCSAVAARSEAAKKRSERQNEMRRIEATMMA